MKNTPTPCARDWKDTPGSKAYSTNPNGTPRDRTDRLAIWVYEVERANGNSTPSNLNPEFSEWLMGWPVGWTDLKPLVTDKFRNVQLWHSVFSQKD